MKVKQIVVVVFLLALAVFLSTDMGGIQAGDLSGRETPINPDGLVYEVFHSAAGELWVSDYFVDEIWRVNPTSGQYTIYSGLIGASDGRLDSSGKLWWSDLQGQALGRLTLGANQATMWTLTEDASPLGIAFDDSGRVWITDVFEPVLYRFTPSSNQLCQYPSPDNGSADYILFNSGVLWLGDTSLGRIVRFNISSNTFTVWQLADNAYPQGMAVDSNGRLWWADSVLGELGRLNPQNNQITTYSVPSVNGVQAKPEMVAVNSEGVWYTDNSGSVGRLDPTQAAGSSTTVAPTSASSTASCANIGAGAAVNVSETSGQLSWTSKNYNVAQNSGGWLVYELPSGAAPWGVALSGDNVWFADQGLISSRPQQLGWLAYSQAFPLPAGWNLISSYIEPPNPDMWDVFNPIIDDVVIVKNGAGEVFWPDFFINDIGDWDVRDGYQLYLRNGVSRTLSGTQVEPDATPIDLLAGWNIAAYLRESPLAAPTALASINGQLVLAKNGAGQVYWPSFGINQIGDLVPGEGYQLNLSGPATLTYPANN